MYVAALLCHVMLGGIVTRSGVLGFWGSGVWSIYFLFFLSGRFYYLQVSTEWKSIWLLINVVIIPSVNMESYGACVHRR